MLLYTEHILVIFIVAVAFTSKVLGQVKSRKYFALDCGSLCIAFTRYMHLNDACNQSHYSGVRV